MASIAKRVESFTDFSHGGIRADSGMDVGTFLGILGGVGLIVIAILRGGDPAVFANLNGALIVLGGTIATTFIAFPSQKVARMFPVIIKAFKPHSFRPADYIDDIVSLAIKYRTGGLKQLEKLQGLVENRFLQNGVSMVVDGYSSREIHENLEREIISMIERHNAGQKILRFMGVQAPVFGMAGTLIGLIQMLMHIDDPTSIGPSLATALITTFYGLILANLVITPIVAKLHTKTEHEAMLNKALRVGILGIHDRMNPQKIRRNMNSLLPPHLQR